MPPSDDDRSKNRPSGGRDGPILDLKAKRLGETGSAKPPESAAGPTGGGTAPKPPGAAGPSSAPMVAAKAGGTADAAKPPVGPSVPTPGPRAAGAVTDAKPAEAKPSETKSAEIKPFEAKPSAAAPVKPPDVRPAEVKPAVPATPGAKPADAAPALGTKSAEIKSAEIKPGETRPGDVKPSDPKSGGPAMTGAKPVLPTEPKVTPGPSSGAVPASGRPGGSTSGASASAVTPTPPRASAHVDPKPPAALPSPPARGGLGAVAAGLLGGVVGAGLLYGLIAVQPDFLRSGAPVSTPAPDPRIAAIEARLGGLATRDALGALGTRLDATDARVAPLADEVKAARDAAAAPKADALQAQAPAAAQTAPPAAPDTAALDGLGRRIDAIEGGMRGLAGTDALRALDARVAAAEEGARSRAAAVGEATGALDRRIGEAASAAAALTGRVDAVTGRADALAGRLDEVAKQAAGAAPAARLTAGLKVVAADRIATALAGGQPYAEALTALQGLDAKAVEGPGLAALQAYAGGGAPTLGALARDVRPVAERVQSADRDAARRGVVATGSITDRLASMAGSIVTVRPVGEAAVTGPHPVVAVRTALDRGDVVAAARAWSALPEAERAIAPDFGATLARRAAAESAAQGVAASALAALTR